MEINFLTIFPKYYEAFKTESIVSKAIQKKLREYNPSLHVRLERVSLGIRNSNMSSSGLNPVQVVVQSYETLGSTVKLKR